MKAQPETVKRVKKETVSDPLNVEVNEFCYNLKIVLSSEEAEILETMCLRIRSEIRHKKGRKQQVGLQTVAQHLFGKMISDEKFRAVVHAAMVESDSVDKNQSALK